MMNQFCDCIKELIQFFISCWNFLSSLNFLLFFLVVGHYFIELQTPDIDVIPAKYLSLSGIYSLRVIF
jgi:hypothetical protein